MYLYVELKKYYTMSTNENIERERVRKIFAVLTTLYNSTRTGWTKIAVSNLILNANLKSPWVTDLSTAMVKHGLIEKQSIYGNVCKWRWTDEDNIPSIELAQKMHNACKLIQLNRKQNNEVVKKTAGLVRLDVCTLEIPTREQIKNVLTKLHKYYCDSPIFINVDILTQNKIPNPEFFMSTLEVLGFIKLVDSSRYKWVNNAEYDPYLETMIFDEYVAKYNAKKTIMNNTKTKTINNILTENKILNFLYELSETNNNGGYPGSLMPMINKHQLTQTHLSSFLALGIVINLSNQRSKPLYKTKGEINLRVAGDVIKYGKQVNKPAEVVAPVRQQVESADNNKAVRLLGVLNILKDTQFVGSLTKYLISQKLSKEFVTTALELGYISNVGPGNKPVYKMLVQPNLTIANNIIVETKKRLHDLELARKTKREKTDPIYRKINIELFDNGASKPARLLKVLKTIHNGNGTQQSLPKLLRANNLHNMTSSVGQKLGFITKSGTVYSLTAEPTMSMATAILAAKKTFFSNGTLPALTKINTEQQPVEKAKVANNNPMDLNVMEDRMIKRKAHLEAELIKVNKVLNAIADVHNMGAELMKDGRD